ncbi:MAG: efflux RND transporter periplasmic adaptor subunit [Bacteroidota bacterium]
MTKRKSNRTLLIVLSLVALVVVGIAAVKARSKPRGAKVSVEKAQKRTIKEIVSASGSIYPEVEVKMSPDVSGEVVELFVEEGDSVSKGQVLARIDPDAYQSQVERGVASVNNAKAQEANARAGIERNKAEITRSTAQKEQIDAQLVNTREIHERNIRLHKEGVISDADFETSESNLKALEANLRSAEATMKTATANLEAAKQTARAATFSVKSAEASLKEMRTTLRRTTIYAPMDGIVSMLNVEAGERVVGTSMMSGTEMMRVANLDAIEVQVEVSENDILRVDKGDKATIEIDAFANRTFDGYVTEIANSATSIGNLSTTSNQVINFLVKIRINPNSYKDLLSQQKRFPFQPGMSATVEISTAVENDILSVPIQSVTTRADEDEAKNKKKMGKEDDEQEEEAKEVVFLAKGDTVSMVEVRTGIQDDDYIQILSGVEEGAEVVSGPYTAISKKLEAGKKIYVVKESELYKKD